MLLLAQKTVRGQRLRLIYSDYDSLFQVQRVVPLKSDPAQVDWVTVDEEPVLESAMYFWNHERTERNPRRIVDPRRH